MSPNQWAVMTGPNVTPDQRAAMHVMWTLEVWPKFLRDNAAKVLGGAPYMNTIADKGTYATDLFKREALRFIRESRDRPWFLYLAFNAVHAPLQAPADEIARSSSTTTISMGE